MPQIFDNIELKLVEGLRAVLPAATASACCVGYLYLRGWGQVADLAEGLSSGEPIWEKMKQFRGAAARAAGGGREAGCGDQGHPSGACVLNAALIMVACAIYNKRSV
jgi:hypothetical protein